MRNKHIIKNQHISPELKARAKAMRSNMTPAESKLWYHLRNNNLANFHFRRQQIIDPYIVDFYCHSENLVVEVDGSGHLDQVEYDQKRDELLNSLGLRVLHFYNLDVIENIDAVLEVILEHCQNNFLAE
ncbi:MAG: endonuclease domain-containing protein [Brevefilum sp.]|nr:endonuclease domain-containing protein [Brevefilum sp.]MDT8381150.1 endonuclease domain-containing protein [Brevefilum sp.]MDW7755493.1 endonuclease domain-containing protein [Brevefilum sp.]